MKRDRKVALSQAAAEGIHMKTPKNPLPLHGIPNYLCERPSEEDTESIAAHIAAMKKDHKKKTTDYALVRSAMNQTFGDRRKLIVEMCPKLVDLQQEYPYLFSYKEVSEIKSKSSTHKTLAANFFHMRKID